MGSERKKRQISPRSDHDANEAAVKEVTDLGDEILRIIEDDVRDSAKAKNAEFFEGVEEKTNGIVETVSRTRRVSEGQLIALRNMLDAVNKWVR